MPTRSGRTYLINFNGRNGPSTAGQPREPRPSILAPDPSLITSSSASRSQVPRQRRSRPQRLTQTAAYEAEPSGAIQELQGNPGFLSEPEICFRNPFQLTGDTVNLGEQLEVPQANAGDSVETGEFDYQYSATTEFDGREGSTQQQPQQEGLLDSNNQAQIDAEIARRVEQYWDRVGLREECIDRSWAQSPLYRPTFQNEGLDMATALRPDLAHPPPPDGPPIDPNQLALPDSGPHEICDRSEPVPSAALLALYTNDSGRFIAQSAAAAAAAAGEHDAEGRMWSRADDAPRKKRSTASTLLFVLWVNLIIQVRYYLTVLLTLAGACSYVLVFIFDLVRQDIFRSGTSILAIMLILALVAATFAAAASSTTTDIGIGSFISHIRDAFPYSSTARQAAGGGGGGGASAAAAAATGQATQQRPH